MCSQCSNTASSHDQPATIILSVEVSRTTNTTKSYLQRRAKMIWLKTNKKLFFLFKYGRFCRVFATFLLLTCSCDELMKCDVTS